MNDELISELEEARIDASDAHGALRTALAELAECNDELRDMGQVIEVAKREYDANVCRGDEYRARALALLQRARKVRGWISLWSQEKQRAELLLASRNEAWDKIEHLSRQNSEVANQSRTTGDAIVALSKLMPFKELEAQKARALAAETQLAQARRDGEQARALLAETADQMRPFTNVNPISGWIPFVKRIDALLAAAPEARRDAGDKK
jgi:hypothetical protein